MRRGKGGRRTARRAVNSLHGAPRRQNSLYGLILMDRVHISVRASLSVKARCSEEILPLYPYSVLLPLLSCYLE